MNLYKSLFFIFLSRRIFGSGALNGKMLLARIIVNDKIEAQFRYGKIK